MPIQEADSFPYVPYVVRIANFIYHYNVDFAFGHEVTSLFPTLYLFLIPKK